MRQPIIHSIKFLQVEIDVDKYLEIGRTKLPEIQQHRSRSEKTICDSDEVIGGGRELLTFFAVTACHLAWLGTFGSHMTIY